MVLKKLGIPYQITGATSVYGGGEQNYLEGYIFIKMLAPTLVSIKKADANH
jgi:hypothetical protein